MLCWGAPDSEDNNDGHARRPCWASWVLLSVCLGVEGVRLRGGQVLLGETECESAKLKGTSTEPRTILHSQEYHFYDF